MKITLKNNTTGVIKTTKLGFSWTGLFFGFFVPMVRGDWKGFLIWFLIGIGVGAVEGVLTVIGNTSTAPEISILVGVIAVILDFAYRIVFACVYNKSYIKRLITKKGFLPVSENFRLELEKKGILVTKIADN